MSHCRRHLPVGEGGVNQFVVIQHVKYLDCETALGMIEIVEPQVERPQAIPIWSDLSDPGVKQCEHLGTELVRRDWDWLVDVQQVPSHMESRNVANHDCNPFLLSAFGLSCHVLLRVNLMPAMMDYIMSIRFIVI